MDGTFDEQAAVGLVGDLASGLLLVDPLGIAAFDRSGDEDRPIARRTGARLGEVGDAGDVARVIHEELTAAYGLRSAGRRARYEPVAGALWFAWGPPCGDDGPPSSATSP